MPHTGHQRSVHYLYRLTDEANGHFYIGMRSCDRRPDEDGNYLGSGKWPLDAKVDRLPLRKDVLATFESRSLLEEAELLLIDLALTDRRCRNSLKTASASFKAMHCRYKGWRKELVREGSFG